MAFVSIIDIVYPVGSVYMSATSTSPATLFGGTWVQIKDTLIGASGDTYGQVGNTGGDAKIRNYNLPEHTHHCVSATSDNGVNSTNNYAGFWDTDASGGSQWKLLSYSNSGANSWLYAGSLTGFSGTKNQDYIPSHYNLAVWQRTA